MVDGGTPPPSPVEATPPRRSARHSEQITSKGVSASLFRSPDSRDSSLATRSSPGDSASPHEESTPRTKRAGGRPKVSPSKKADFVRRAQQQQRNIARGNSGKTTKTQPLVAQRSPAAPAEQHTLVADDQITRSRWTPQPVEPPIRKERRAKNDLEFSPTTGRRIRRKTANVVDTIKTQARSDTQEKKRLVRSLLHHPELRDAFEEECATSRSAAEIAMDNLAANIKATSSRTREGRVARDSMRASVCPGTAKFPGVNKVAKRLNVDRKAMSRSNARMKDEHGMSQRPPIVREKDNRDTTGAEMMASFAQKLEKWIGFDFIGRWQMKHIKGARTSIHLRMRCPCVHVYRSNEQPTTECSCLQL